MALSLLEKAHQEQANMLSLLSKYIVLVMTVLGYPFNILKCRNSKFKRNSKFRFAKH